MSEENEYKCIVSGEDEEDESTIMLRSEGLRKVTSLVCSARPDNAGKLISGKDRILLLYKQIFVILAPLLFPAS